MACSVNPAVTADTITAVDDDSDDAADCKLLITSGDRYSKSAHTRANNVSSYPT